MCEKFAGSGTVLKCADFMKMLPLPFDDLMYIENTVLDL